jgi:hypothetical protein
MAQGWTDSRFLGWVRNPDTIEIIEAVLLSLATIVTAWSAYQAALWDGEQSALYTQASAARADGNRLDNEANTQVAIDVSEYETWLTATTQDNVQEAALIRRQMRSELQSTLDAWLAAGGLERTRESVPASPFSMPGYTVAEREESKARITLAEQHFVEGEEANRRSDKYVLLTVVFALVLFVVGIGSKFKNASVRASLAGFGIFALVAGTAFMLSLPVAELAL